MAVRSDDVDYVTAAEFLADEERSRTKHEWVNGAVYAMAGAGKRHGRVVMALSAALYPAAHSLGCTLIAADLLVKTANAYYYPDLVATCRPSDDERVEENPCFIAEVASRSTKSIDRREKMNAYTALPTLHDYWIIDPERRSVEVWHRGDHGWARATFVGSAVLPVTCLGIEIEVSSLFVDS